MKFAMRRSAICVSLLAALAWAAVIVGAAASAAPPKSTAELRYERRPTRQATFEAALADNEWPVLEAWSALGPLDPILRRPLPPQEQPALDVEHPLDNGTRGRWQPTEFFDGHVQPLDLSRLTERDLKKKPTWCLRRRIVAPRAEKLRVYLGCDQPFVVWLNGQPLHYAGTVTEFVAGQETVDLPLVAGENWLVIKVALGAVPCRLFFVPELGRGPTDALFARLEADFPTGLKRPTDYREASARFSLDTEARSYRLVEIPVPEGSVIEGAGMEFLPDGRLAVATRRGVVYLIENATDPDPRRARFVRFAEGLHEPMGLGIVDGQVLVVERGQVTRLVDTDGDQRADRHETVADGWGLTGNYHEYAYGLARDRAGALYMALNISFGKGGPSADATYRGCVLRQTPEGRLEPVACGLRSPNGIGENLLGDVFVTDNQGEWVASSPVYHVRPGSWFGHATGIGWYPYLVGVDKGTRVDADHPPPRTPPAVWMPYEELAQSATDIACDTTGGQFGPFAGQLFIGEMTKGLVARVQLEQIDGQYQGACFLMRRGCGAVNRLCFGPDGSLYFARCNRGWGGGGLGDGLGRIEFTGVVPFEILAVRLERDGFELEFTRPLGPKAGAEPADYRLRQYGYHHWATYGSPKIDQRTLAVTRVDVAPDRRRVKLTVAGLQAGRVCQILCPRLTSADGEPLLHAETHYTLNRFPADTAAE